ncbi:MAG: DNA-directed RNA polymerase subunit P [Candidatus Diapherotrites archaeon]|uniref:DNA-directed RNA polymerase subunit Rpo12 n=1 Tax=Candidatus Iainarchaeum sp. TaxID=3101447 RepID=A0A7J4IUB3_9ARCH|nr:MAG: hypothetical protein QT03_C0001G1361 [archaeon GW2011_AR10]MBS3059281.1 DNA-directed RNA polymerase subunit P [Candidatus Diapherotrites archaeon]HIH07835.1 DNA-directed RNA polymerase subunit P [Candidatus Diapherotrites archaeon]
MYKCTKCGHQFDKLMEGVIRCQSCAHKILTRIRDPITKEVKAR